MKHQSSNKQLGMQVHPPFVYMHGFLCVFSGLQPTAYSLQPAYGRQAGS
jgi:hypothetical protein